MNSETMQIAPGMLAELVGSRLCHDLISPLGAIGNGVELLEMSDAFPGIGRSDELRLIAESVQAARARIQAFRMAFGQAQDTQRVGHTELQRLLDSMAHQGRLSIRLDAAGDFPRTEARMIILALMCLETVMPWGGQVTVVQAQRIWRLVAESDRMKPDPRLWAVLGPSGNSPDARTPSASEVHFPLLTEAAVTAGRLLRWEVDERGAEITF